MRRLAPFLLGCNRLVFGVRFLLDPQAAGPTWVGGRAARRPATQLFVRALGARDIALALGALRALGTRRFDEARVWIAGHALADGVDLAATLAVRDDLPARPRRLALAVAGVSTLIGATSALTLRP
jgi:hypothetical protein